MVYPAELTDLLPTARIIDSIGGLAQLLDQHSAQQGFAAGGEVIKRSYQLGCKVGGNCGGKLHHGGKAESLPLDCGTSSLY